MKNIATMILIAATMALALPVFAGDLVRGPNIHFDTNSDRVINAATLDQFLETVSDRVEMLYIYCHTDRRGSAEYNKSLAQDRCTTVKNLIETNFNIKATSYVVMGETQGEVAEMGPDKAGREGINRRVEILYSVHEVEQKAQQQVTRLVFKRHRVTLAGGYAPSGLQAARQTGPNEFTVESDFDIEAMISYHFSLTPTFSLNLSAITNKSGFFGFGLDF